MAPAAAAQVPGAISSVSHAGPAPDETDTACSVWWATARPRPELVALLDAAERQRAERLRRTVDRDRYVTAHALVRILLSARTGIPPQALRFETTCHRCGGGHGKPRLDSDPGDAQVAFNLAHAGNRVVVALTGGLHVGIDVDVVRNLDREDLAMLSGEILSTAERVSYAELPSCERSRALAVWWTRKEAVLKATGDGLAIPPAHISVTDPGSAPAVTAWDPGRTWPSPMAAVTCLRDLSPGAPYVASVAVLGTDALTVTEQAGDALLGDPWEPPLRHSPGPIRLLTGTPHTLRSW